MTIDHDPKGRQVEPYLKETWESEDTHQPDHNQGMHQKVVRRVVAIIARYHDDRCLHAIALAFMTYCCASCFQTR